MSKKHKILMTVMVVGLAGCLAGFGVFSAFSSTTSNPGNTFQAGTVAISDNDGDAALFSNATKAKPEVDYDKCVKVTYTGNLDASVKLYTSAIDADGSSFNVTVSKGTGDANDCSDFVSDATVYSTDTLSAFGAAHTDWDDGLAVNPGAATKWVTNDALTFRVRLNVIDDNANQDASIPSFEITWEAQNQ